MISQAQDLWNNSEKAKTVLRERSELQETINAFSELESLQQETEAALELALDGGDADFATEALRCGAALKAALEHQEFFCKMRKPHDRANAILEVNAGSGGTEAQDWAAMLLRMYLRWAERKGFAVEEIDSQPGEEAGLKGVAVLVKGPYAYGHLRSEQGVHRLVRISPFDANARRHTSFASIAVTPVIEEELEIEINENDLKIDTFRASGAGGQHVNKTDSAVRITHLPTGTVVTCRNERSQHMNKAVAMKVLKSKLFEMEEARQQQALDAIRGERKSIDFGSQIRSYVLHPYKLVKDLRTDFETSAAEAVLDGAIDQFIESYLLT